MATDLTTNGTTVPATNQRVDRLLEAFNAQTQELAELRTKNQALVDEHAQMLGTLEGDLQESKAAQKAQQCENRGRINHGAAIAPLLAAAAGDRAMSSRVLKATGRMMDVYLLQAQISRDWPDSEANAAPKQAVLDKLAQIQRLAGIEAAAVAYVASLPAQAKRFQLQELIETHARAGALLAPERPLAIGEFDALFVIPDSVLSRAKAQLREMEPSKASTGDGNPNKRPWLGNKGLAKASHQPIGPFNPPSGATASD